MNIVETPPKSLAKPLAADLIARFVAIVGEKHAITDPQAQAPYLVEMRDMMTFLLHSSGSARIGMFGAQSPALISPIAREPT